MWKCPRFTKQRLKKGAFYFEKAPTKDNVMRYTGINNVKTVLKYYGKGNPGYQIKDEDYSDQIKESLMSRLSFNCVFQRIRIPDGGSCCEWIGAALLLSMSETSDYMEDLNALRKLLKLQAIRLSGNAHDVTQELRSLYAMSLTYDYQPNVHDFLGKYQEGLGDLNYIYCSNVLNHMRKLCNINESFNNLLFQQCCRNFITLSPANVGKFGCMWGQDDFLDWFQCVFNIRIFVINLQSFDMNESFIYDTSADFAQGFKYRRPEQTENPNVNDDIFDLSDENRIIPRGIMIVLMEDQHFDEIIRPYNQISPLIDAGSEIVLHILPFLKISKKVWSSLDTKTIQSHNEEVIYYKKSDKNGVLNLWFDHNVAYAKWRKEKNETLGYSFHLSTTYEDSTEPSVPSCSIKYHGSYIAHLCFAHATGNMEKYQYLLEMHELYLIDISEDENETNTLCKHLDSETSKLVERSIIDESHDGNPFSIDKFIQDHKSTLEMYRTKSYNIEKNKIIEKEGEGLMLTQFNPNISSCTSMNIEQATASIEKGEYVVPDHLIKKERKHKKKRKKIIQYGFYITWK